MLFYFVEKKIIFFPIQFVELHVFVEEFGCMVEHIHPMKQEGVNCYHSCLNLVYSRLAVVSNVWYLCTNTSGWDQKSCYFKEQSTFYNIVPSNACPVPSTSWLQQKERTSDTVKHLRKWSEMNEWNVNCAIGQGAKPLVTHQWILLFTFLDLRGWSTLCISWYSYLCWLCLERMCSNFSYVQDTSPCLDVCRNFVLVP